jgi:hypothetical protein
MQSIEKKKLSCLKFRPEIADAIIAEKKGNERYLDREIRRRTQQIV